MTRKLNSEQCARTYNLNSQDDTKAVVTPDGGVQVRRISKPRDGNFPDVVLATADPYGRVTYTPGNEDYGDMLAACAVTIQD